MEDRLAVANVKRDDPGFAVVGAFEPFGGPAEFGSAEPGGEVEDGSIGDRHVEGTKVSFATAAVDQLER